MLELLQENGEIQRRAAETPRVVEAVPQHLADNHGTNAAGGFLKL